MKIEKTRDTDSRQALYNENGAKQVNINIKKSFNLSSTTFN